MPPELWSRIERLFLEAIELPAQDRLQYVRSRSGGDSELKASVESLLRRHRSSAEFLSSPWRILQVIGREPCYKADDVIASRFRFVGYIGRGGMGVVLEAYDLRLQRDVALKILPPHFAGDADRMRRFEAEAQITSRLNHPNILTVHDTGVVDGCPYIVSELLRGHSLRERISSGPLPVAEALAYARQIVAGLSAAHELGVVHRDMKPENIFVSPEGAIKILDFGLAKLVTAEPLLRPPEAGLTVPGMILGTAGYMSPEQVHGEAADRRSDVFGFGAVLYEMLSGRLPFQGRSPAEVMVAVLRDAPSPFEPSLSVPSSLENVVRKCLEKEPASRFQTTHEIASALDALVLYAERPPVHGEKRRKLVRVAAGLASLLFAFTIALLWWTRPRIAPSAGFGESFVPLPLTSYPGYEIGPTVSPDGSRIAFAWTGGELQNLDIYAKDIGSGAPLRLTSTSDRDFSPAWSPDGRWIAFIRELSRQHARFAIVLMPSSGGHERTIAVVNRIPFGEFPAAGFVGSGISWSRDSRWIVATDSEGRGSTQQLVAFNLASGGKRVLTFPPQSGWGDLDPEVSPDGRTIAFARMIGYDGAQLYRLDIDGTCTPTGEPRLVNPFRAHIGDLTWDALGKSLIFSVGAGRRTLRRTSIGESRQPQRLPILADFASAAQIMGRDRLVFVQRRVDTNIWRLWIDGKSELIRPLASTSGEGAAQLSPDGRKIVFAYNARASEVGLASSDGSAAARLAGDGEHDAGSPRWSPDGRYVAFRTSTGSVFNIYVVSAGGGEPRRVTDEQVDANVPTWSADGRWIYFMSRRTGRSELFKVPAVGGGVQQVTANGGAFGLESSDGEWLFYARGNESADIWQRNLKSGEDSVVVNNVSVTEFALSKHAIWFLRRAESGRFSLCLYDLEHRRTRTLATFDRRPDVGPLSVSPDENYVLYAQVDSEGSDLMMIENFR